MDRDTTSRIERCLDVVPGRRLELRWACRSDRRDASILLDEKKWISEERFLHALNYCMLLPGPEAQQLATYIGWLLHRTLGGLTAGLLFIFPGFVSILGLSVLYAHFQQTDFVQAVFFGLKPAVLACIAQQAVERFGWLHPGEMLDGLGMAETTPGPLIQVVQVALFAVLLTFYFHRSPAQTLAASAGLGAILYYLQ
jgi:chromate transport protein ChrA